MISKNDPFFGNAPCVKQRITTDTVAGANLGVPVINRQNRDNFRLEKAWVI